jgi:carbamoyltransferase
MKLLGISMTYHDNNASYFDGNVVRYHKFERTKQQKRFQWDSAWEWIKDVEDLWNFKIEDIDQIAIDFDINSSMFDKDDDGSSIFENIPELNYKISDEKNPFLVYGVKNIWHVDHHYSHALSTWMLEDTNNEPKIRIVVDGAGDYQGFSVFKDHKKIRSGHIKNGSIGLKMKWAGEYLGVQSNNPIDHAGKVMGIQSYGEVDNEFLNKLNNFTIDEINSIFDIEIWKDHIGDDLLSRLKPLDWIRTVHERLGSLLVDFFSEYASSKDIISYSGGVAQNVVWNTELLKKFNNIIIPPHSGDEGTSLGLIEFLRKKNNLSNFIINNFPYCQNDYSPNSNPSEETIKTAAKLLSEGNIVGWYQKNGEVGPRALGNRSILMDPRIKDGKKKINSVKKRENYRPFGASILREHLVNYFEFDIKDSFMLFTNNFITDEFPSITHVDKTCRVQTVEKNMGDFRKLIEEFYKITNCPMVLNTSLNIAGKPIAGYPQNAIDLLCTSVIDYMVIGDKIYGKR